MINHSLWHRRFAADPGVSSRSVRMLFVAGLAAYLASRAAARVDLLAVLREE